MLSPHLSFAAFPPTMPPPDLSEPAVGHAPWQVRRWNVTHACEETAPVATLAQAQLEVGMRPALLTPEGWFRPGVNLAPAHPRSLIHAWRNVRHWRNVFARESIGNAGEVLHAHCFSAAMAGIRAGLPVVYDIVAPLSETAPNAGAWLLRSLRVAESFALSRASAVVVHSPTTWSWALDSGTRAEDLFLVPDPVMVPATLVDSTSWLTQRTGTRRAVTFFASALDFRTAEQLKRLLSAFALLSEEVEDAHLLVETGDKDALRQLPGAGESGSRVHAVDPGQREQALSASDIVIAFGSSGTAIDALAYGRALLAADIPENREITPNGRGCLWFQPGSDRDLVFRASFLARNPDFRAALGGNGRAHIQSTRGLAPIARRYDSVYRHAVKRRQAGNRPDIFHHFPALACC